MSEVALELERTMRKQLGLPITKQLVYYDNDFNKYNIISYSVYENHDSYDTIEIKLENKKKIKIHEAFLREMQLPHYKEYIIEMRNNNE